MFHVFYKTRQEFSSRRLKIACNSLGCVEEGAHTAAQEDEHGEERADPQLERHIEVVGHGPPEASVGNSHRASANIVVLGHQKDTGGNEDGKLEQAGDRGADHVADSEVVSPGTNEHAKGIASDNSVHGAQQDGNQGQLGSPLLAVHVAVLGKVDECVHKLAVVGSVKGDVSSDSDIYIPGVGAVIVSLRVHVDLLPGLGVSSDITLPLSLVGACSVLRSRHLVVGIFAIPAGLGGAYVLVVEASVPSIEECAVGAVVA